MKIQHILIGLWLFSGQLFAQEKLTTIDTENLTEEQLQHLDDFVSKDGWVQLIHENKTYISNFSNPEYSLRVQLKCINEQPPGFLIEFTDKYRDGDYGGIDYLSVDDTRTVNFIVDGVDFRNPFIEQATGKFSDFVAALKKGKLLRIVVLDDRSIDFKLANAQLLDIAVDCYERHAVATDTVEVEEAVIAE